MVNMSASRMRKPERPQPGVQGAQRQPPTGPCDSHSGSRCAYGLSHPQGPEAGCQGSLGSNRPLPRCLKHSHQQHRKQAVQQLAWGSWAACNAAMGSLGTRERHLGGGCPTPKEEAEERPSLLGVSRSKSGYCPSIQESLADKRRRIFREPPEHSSQPAPTPVPVAGLVKAGSE
jgi:hypothetical protein